MRKYTGDDQFRYSVVDTCLAIYGSMSGTGDPMTEAEANRRLDWLRWRVGEGWSKQSLEGWAPYEEAIRKMTIELLKAMGADMGRFAQDEGGPPGSRWDGDAITTACGFRVTPDDSEHLTLTNPYGIEMQIDQHEYQAIVAVARRSDSRGRLK